MCDHWHRPATAPLWAPTPPKCPRPSMAPFWDYIASQFKVWCGSESGFPLWNADLDPTSRSDAELCGSGAATLAAYYFYVGSNFCKQRKDAKKDAPSDSKFGTYNKVHSERSLGQKSFNHPVTIFVNLSFRYPGAPKYCSVCRAGLGLFCNP